MSALRFSLLLVIFELGSAIVCPQGWSYFGDKCWFKSSHESTWLDADSECRDRYGASLATVQNDRESMFVERLTKELSYSQRFLDATTSNEKLIDCFLKLENTVLLGASVMSPASAKSAEQCLEECAGAQEKYDQTCNSLMWYRESKECVLNDKTRNDTDAIFVQDPAVSANIDYFEKTCVPPSEVETEVVSQVSLTKSKPISSHKGEVPGVRSCFTKFKHSSLVGYADRVIDNVTERECLSRCWKCAVCLSDEQQPCKSVTYYPSAKQCILIKESRRNVEYYFDRAEPLSIFFERRRDCLFEICEDQEVDLVFAVDGSAKMNWYGFNRSLALIDQIVSTVHETTEFWRATIVQVGTEGPAVVELNRQSFDNLDEFRRALATICWRRSPGSRLGDSLVDVADLAMKFALDSETDFVWLMVFTNGFTNDSLSDYELLKQKNAFTSFAIGVGSDLEFVNLQRIASSSDYLIHSQDAKVVVREISSKLCAHTEGPIAPEAHGSAPSQTESSMLASMEGVKQPSTKPDEFVSQTDAYRSTNAVFRDDIRRWDSLRSPFPTASRFYGEQSVKHLAKHDSLLEAGKAIIQKSIDFIKDMHNDSVLIDDEESEGPEETPVWLGLRRNDLGQMEWSDGSRLEVFETAILRHLDVELDHGDCIQWNGKYTWIQSNCAKKYIFVCSVRPTMTINERLDHEFANAKFDQAVVLSKELATFDVDGKEMTHSASVAPIVSPTTSSAPPNSPPNHPSENNLNETPADPIISPEQSTALRAPTFPFGGDYWPRRPTRPMAMPTNLPTPAPLSYPYNPMEMFPSFGSSNSAGGWRAPLPEPNDTRRRAFEATVSAMTPDAMLRNNNMSNFLVPFG